MSLFRVTGDFLEIAATGMRIVESMFSDLTHSYISCSVALLRVLSGVTRRSQIRMEDEEIYRFISFSRESIRGIVHPRV